MIWGGFQPPQINKALIIPDRSNRIRQTANKEIELINVTAHRIAAEKDKR